MPQFKSSILWHSAFFTVQLSHPYMTTGKTIDLTRLTFVGKIISLLFSVLSSFVITFLPRSKASFNFMAAITICSDFGAQKIKSHTVSTVSPSTSYEVMGPDAMIFVFWILSFKPTFSLSSFTFTKRLYSSSSLSAIRVVSSAYLRLLIFLLAVLIPACASSSSALLMDLPVTWAFVPETKCHSLQVCGYLVPPCAGCRQCGLPVQVTVYLSFCSKGWGVQDKPSEKIYFLFSLPDVSRKP